MADFFFFTDIDLLTTADLASSGQLNSDSFGHVSTVSSNEQFLVSSVFKSSIPAQKPKAYAITGGHIAAIVHSSNNFLTLVLKPKIQPGSRKHVTLPKVKYFIYRGILPSSLFNTALTEINTTLNEIELRDLILNSYPDFVSSSIAPPADAVKAFEESSLGLNTLVEKSFLEKAGASAYPLVEAGMSIGEFDPLNFSVEIILEDMGYEPTLQMIGNTADPIRHYIVAPVMPSSPSPTQYFTSRSAQEEVLHYFDCCMLYGAFFSNYKSITARTSSGSTLSINSEADYYNFLLVKFYNQSKAILDIRNEYNNSFNYYKFAFDDYFSSYNDNVFFKFDSAGGSNTLTTSYYSNGWPLLVISNDVVSDNFHALSGNKVVLNLEFDKGNNLNPLGYISCGFPSRGSVSGSFSKDVATGKKRFVELKDSTSNVGFYGALLLEIPSVTQTSSSQIKIVPSYIRLKYLKRLDENIKYDLDSPTNPLDAIPSPDEVQFLDYLFEPAKMGFLTPYVAGKNRIRIFEEERYLNLLQHHHAGTEMVVNLGIAEDDQNVTLFAFAFAKRKRGTRRVKKALNLISSEETLNSDFLHELDEKYKFNNLREGKLYFNTVSNSVIDTASFKDRKIIRLLARFVDPSSAEFVAVVIDKGNYNAMLATIQGLPVNIIGRQLVLTNRNDRSGIIDDDFDDTALIATIPSSNIPRKTDYKYFRTDLGINEFDINAVVRTIQQANIRVYAEVNEDNNQILNVFKDADADFSATTPVAYECHVNYNASRPIPVTGYGFQFDMNVLIPTNYNMLASDINLDASGANFNKFKKYSQNILGRVYREDLQFVIFEAFRSAFNSRTTPSVIQKFPSFLMYKYVASRFIDLDSTEYVIPFNHLSKTETGSVKIFTPAGFVDTNAAITNAGNISLKTVGGNLVLPKIFEQSLLLDFSVYFAIYKASRDLEAITSYLIGKKTGAGILYDNTGIIYSAGASHFGATGDFGEDYYKVLVDLLKTDYPFYYNLLVCLERNGLPYPRENTRTFNTQAQFVNFVDLLYPHQLFTTGSGNSYSQSIQNAYSDINGTTMTSIQVKQVIDALNETKTEYIKELATCIFRELGGVLDCINLEIVGLIKGGQSSFLFDSVIKGGFFMNTSVEVRAGNLRPVFRNAVGAPNVDLIKFDFDLSHTDDKNNYLHWFILGLDDNRFWQENGAGIPPSPTPALSLKKSATSFHKVTAFKTASKVIDGNILKLFVYPDGVYNNPTPKSWGIQKDLSNDWVSTGGELLGLYKDNTKEIILSDIVTGVSVASQSITDNAANNDNNVIFFTTYCYDIQNPYYVFSAEDLFKDDKFLITQTKKDKLFQPSDISFLDFIIERIQDPNLLVQVNMIGGAVGRSILPEPFDSNSSYLASEFVVKNTHVYKANTAISPGAFNSSQWTLNDFSTGASYQAGDYVWFDNTTYKAIYRALIANGPSGGDPDVTTANWELICKVYEAGKSYVRNNIVLVGDEADNRMHRCLQANRDVSFNPNKWLNISAVNTDSDYQFTLPNYFAAKTEETINPAKPSSSDPLKAKKYSRLRYSYASIEYELSSNTVIINVQSYASPVRSRLDKNLQSGKKPLIDPFTIYGQVLANNSLAVANSIGAKQVTGSGFIFPSYNRLLTSLRCFGFLEAIFEQVQAYADIQNSSAVDTVVQSWISDVLTNVAAVEAVATGPLSVPQKIITKAEYDPIRLAETP